MMPALRVFDGLAVGESRACGAAVPRYEGEACDAVVLRYPGGRGGSLGKRSDGLGNQPAMGSPSAPVSNANEALGWARESSAQNEKIA